MATNVIGTVYLIELDRPLHHSRHYIGWALNLKGRLWHHQHGSGARFLAAARAAGIGWHVVRTWQGDRYLERKLKNYKKASHFCPACQARIKVGSVT